MNDYPDCDDMIETAANAIGTEKMGMTRGKARKIVANVLAEVADKLTTTVRTALEILSSPMEPIDDEEIGAAFERREGIKNWEDFKAGADAAQRILGIEVKS
jgi:hypothetical protein